MPTHAELASKLLMDSAAFFKKLADSNDDARQDMLENASVFEKVSGLIGSDPQGQVNGKPHTELASRLLKDAADFFRKIAEENEPIKEQMHENARVFDQIADLVAQDPQGILD